MRNTIGHFSIYGDFDAEEITTALGMQPSAGTPKGTWYEGADFPSKVAEWELYCPAELSAAEQVNYLLGELWPRASALRSLAQKYRADFNISGDEVEVMELRPEMLQKLAHLHVNLNCFFDVGDKDAD